MRAPEPHRGPCPAPWGASSPAPFWRPRGCAIAAFLVLSVVCPPRIVAVDRSKFRTCGDTGFCKIYRKAESLPKFRVDEASVRLDGKSGFLGAKLLGEGEGLERPLDLSLTVRFYSDGSSRVKIVESRPIRTRWEPPDIVMESDLKLVPYTTEKSATGLKATYAGDRVLSVQYNPFQVDLLVGGKPVVGLNKGGLLHFEPYKLKKGDEGHHEQIESKDRHKGKKIIGYWEDGLARYEDGTTEEKLSEDEVAKERRLAVVTSEDSSEEYFGGHTDARVFGPASVGIDIKFHNSQHLYGLPEHASSFRLKTTSGEGAAYKEPYRLYNLDVFEYELDEPMALYGSIPFVASHTPQTSAGAFYFNPTETFVDVEEMADGTSTHWMSEAGVLDIFLLPGPQPLDVFKQLTTVVGQQALPPVFALGYHQCRWNYKDEKDVANVHAKFEELDFPYDVLWLDIEHTDGKRYFTWDKRLFPDPVKMQQSLSAQGRRMVTIIDPHLKRDTNYRIHTEATAKGLYIKDKSGEDFDGFCWPGSSSYLDFTAPHVRQWWAEQFALDKYSGSTLDLFTWNDMNEPSVFNGPEVSMPKDCKNLAGVEHREWHNLYGIYMQRATAEGITLRDPEKLARPFVLSRAFYAGSQRYGAIWTGDNKASWDHLKIASPMLLSINIAGLSFSGADVGGFFGDTEAELMTRWMQAGAFQPFFRGHAHHDTKRKEPWVYGEPTTSIIRDAVVARYTFMPYWYSVFYQAYKDGLPVMRPIWAHYPTEAATFDMDDQWLIGQDLLVKPVTAAGVAELEVYFPGSEAWYDIKSYEALKGPGLIKVPAPLNKIPVYQRAGSIVPRKLRLRRSTKLMSHDPYTVVVALDKKGEAAGQLYMDDETTLRHATKHEYSVRQLAFKAGLLSSTKAGGQGSAYANAIERIVVLGLSHKPSSVMATPQAGKVRTLDFDFEPKTKVLTIRKPEVGADADWTISIK